MKLTSEHFESADLTIYQPANGHRYGGESLLLADFCSAAPYERIVEFGSGVGVVALLVARRLGVSKIVVVEIQEELHRIALKNIMLNDMGRQVVCVNDDWRSFASDNRSSFDVVISNPPFYAAGSGRQSADPQRATARHEIAGTISDLIVSAKNALRPSGRFEMVFTKSREDELLSIAEENGFRIVRSQNALDDVFLVEFRLE